VAQCAGDPALADAGGADDRQVVVMVDPVAGDEPGQEGAVDATRGAQVDVLGRRVLAQGGELETGRRAATVALGGLAVGIVRAVGAGCSGLMHPAGPRCAFRTRVCL
jgi:hypothetical protein